MFSVYLLLLIVSSIAKAVQDTITHHFSTSIFVGKSDWWNPEKSWKLKYKKDKLEPRFFGSTTFFVWITDAWHCMYFIHATAWQLIVAFVLSENFTIAWYYFVPAFVFIVKVIFGSTFELFYTSILKKKL